MRLKAAGLIFRAAERQSRQSNFPAGLAARHGSDEFNFLRSGAAPNTFAGFPAGLVARYGSEFNLPRSGAAVKAKATSLPHSGVAVKAFATTADGLATIISAGA